MSKHSTAWQDQHIRSVLGVLPGDARCVQWLRPEIDSSCFVHDRQVSYVSVRVTVAAFRFASEGF